MKSFTILTTIIFFLLISKGQLSANPLDERGPIEVSPSSLFQNWHYITKPDSVSVLEENTFSAQVSTTHYNYWELSKDSEKEGFRFVFDGEINLLDVSVNYGLLENVEIGLQGRLTTFTGGFLDEFIEGFHRAFGFGDALRKDNSRNLFRVYLQIPNSPKFFYISYEDSKTQSYLSQLVLNIKLEIVENFFSGKISYKLPWSGFLGTQALDLKLMFEFNTDQLKLFLNLGFYWNQKAVFFDHFNLRSLIGYSLPGFRYTVNQNVALIGQFYIQSPAFKNDYYTKYIQGPVVEAQGGIQFYFDQNFITVGITEDGISTDNIADVGFYINYERIF